MNQFMKIAVIGALTAVCTTATADEKILKQCRAIKSELSRLQSLREDGGSAKKWIPGNGVCMTSRMNIQNCIVDNTGSSSINTEILLHGAGTP